MRQDTIKIYKFEELSEDAKAKAIENNRQWNVEFDWWDSTYECFASFCKLLGIEIETLPKTNPQAIGENFKIYFRLHCQGEGAAIDSESFDALEVAEKVRGEVWKEEFPELEPQLTVPPKARDLLKRPCMRDLVTASLWERTQYSNSTSADWEIDYACGERIEKLLDPFAEWVEDLSKDLESLLVKWLNREYDYLTSDESIGESLEVNEMEFTEDGEDY